MSNGNTYSTCKILCLVNVCILLTSLDLHKWSSILAGIGRSYHQLAFCEVCSECLQKCQWKLTFMTKNRPCFKCFLTSCDPWPFSMNRKVLSFDICIPTLAFKLKTVFWYKTIFVNLFYLFLDSLWSWHLSEVTQIEILYLERLYHRVSLGQVWNLCLK